MRKIHIYILLFLAFLAAAAAWVYTLILVHQLSKSEKQRIELWSEAYREIQKIDVNQQISPLIIDIIKSNKSIPVILVDNKGRIISYANLDSLKARDTSYLHSQLKKMQARRKPIQIKLDENNKQFLYYKDSRLLTSLFYFPIIQLIVVIIFLVVIFFAGLSAARAEENELWVLMSKETAHQLGTPISSLVAWVEMLKMMDFDPQLLKEVEKDVLRLEAVTERFSSIGTQPKLEKHDLEAVIEEVIDYLRVRTSKRIRYEISFLTQGSVHVNINKTLFTWVIENLAKNAIDAMEGQGIIKITVTQDNSKIIIDIKDQGKGMPWRKARQVFKPGYTTKKHGWGMGLALAKRIIENYHKGKIFISATSPGKGTTFRIILRKAI